MVRYIASLQKRVQWLESMIREQGNNIDDGPPLDFMEISQVETIHDDEPVESAAAAIPRSRRSPSPTQPGQPLPLGGSQPSRTQSRQAHEIGLVSLSSGGEPRYIGPSSGYFLANLVFSNTGRRARPAGNRGSENDPVSLSPLTYSIALHLYQRAKKMLSRCLQNILHLFISCIRFCTNHLICNGWTRCTRTGR